MRYRYSRGFSLSSLEFIILANVLVFIATLVRPEFTQLFGLQPATLSQRPWTIITNLFIHADFTHIFFNMLALYFFGLYLERMVGERNFLLIYFIGGIVGNILFILLGPQYAIAVGASGAIFAVGGALAVLRPKLPVFIFPIPVPIPLWIAVIGGLVLSLLPEIAWEAHLGGLLLGLAAGYYLKRSGRYLW